MISQTEPSNLGSADRCEHRPHRLRGRSRAHSLARARLPPHPDTSPVRRPSWSRSVNRTAQRRGVPVAPRASRWKPCPVAVLPSGAAVQVVQGAVMAAGRSMWIDRSRRQGPPVCAILAVGSVPRPRRAHGVRRTARSRDADSTCSGSPAVYTASRACARAVPDDRAWVKKQATDDRFNRLCAV